MKSDNFSIFTFLPEKLKAIVDYFRDLYIILQQIKGEYGFFD